MQHHLVIGSGPVGSGIAQRLADQGSPVTVLTRSGTGPAHPSITLVKGDAADAAALTRHAEGAATIFNCANPPYHRWGTDWPPMHQAIMTAAERTGAVVAMIVGGAIGIISGYFGGKTDNVMMRTTDYFLVLPDLVLMIVVASIWGRSLRNIIIIIGLIYWTFMARLIRSQVKVVRERAYVKRAQALGATHTRIIFKHVIPQIAPLLLAQTVLMVALAIFLETAISFLGLGDPSVTSWGKMIETAFSRSAISYGAWWAIAPPGIAVALVIMAFNMVGTAAEDSLNPRLKVSHLSRRHFRLRPLPDKEAPK
jgi:peptide/nickel transport system permease protein